MSSSALMPNQSYKGRHRKTEAGNIPHGVKAMSRKTPGRTGPIRQKSVRADGPTKSCDRRFHQEKQYVPHRDRASGFCYDIHGHLAEIEVRPNTARCRNARFLIDVANHGHGKGIGVMPYVERYGVASIMTSSME